MMKRRGRRSGLKDLGSSIRGINRRVMGRREIMEVSKGIRNLGEAAAAVMEGTIIGSMIGEEIIEDGELMDD